MASKGKRLLGQMEGGGVSEFIFVIFFSSKKKGRRMMTNGLRWHLTRQWVPIVDSHLSRPLSRRMRTSAPRSPASLLWLWRPHNCWQCIFPQICDISTSFLTFFCHVLIILFRVFFAIVLFCRLFLWFTTFFLVFSPSFQSIFLTFPIGAIVW